MSCQDFGMSLVDDESVEDDYPYVPGIGTGTRGFISNLNRANFSIGSPPTGCSPDENLYNGRKICLGVCAMAKKVKSKPMHEILKRLSYFAFLEIVIFEEEVILESEVEDWPIVDCLICFHSAGFPLDKAVIYDKLRHPYTINNLNMQYELMDRRSVHDILAQQGIDQPKFAIIDRDKNTRRASNELIEHEDHIEVNGVTFHKPFVEKPISAEDHNVYIYFPSAAGGGSQRLFRKIGSRSSVYSPVSRVRTTGSYVYEEFMPTDGTDVKVYTVGADYAHAEARKAPALDGKVERDQNGKEVRYPVILTAKEKMIARKVCMAFQQNVCGFDLLRANGVSYVCDVNGFSFVKTSSKYYDDCATVLGSMILRELAPQLSMHVPPELASLEVLPIVPTTYGTMMELRCVIAVIRHGDRTPKQKMKMEVKHQLFFDLFSKYDGHKSGQLKLKKPTQLQEVLDIARKLLEEIDSCSAPPELEEKKTKLIQLKFVLEMYGHFSGINRKVQLKYQPQGFVSASSADEAERDPSLVLILKWGGELTPTGKTQAEELGRAFRCMYPTYGETPGLGLLRLHSTYRHDLKIYASDEGRVQMTAAAFAKGFLALEGELTPILVQMVKSGTHTNGLLDNADEAQPLQQQAKQALQEVLNKKAELTEEEWQRINPVRSISIDQACKVIKNPFTTLETIYEYIGKLLCKIKLIKSDPKVCGRDTYPSARHTSSYHNKLLYHGESLDLMWRRWWKLEKDFKQKNGQFDVSKIPDIFDSIKYDLQHNGNVLDMDVADRLYILSKACADIVIPQEYGLTTSEKVKIGANIAKPLLRKIKADLLTNAQESEEYTRLDSRFSMGVTSPDRHVRTRLYFTSESHIHSLLSLINHGGLVDKCDDQWCRAQEFLSGVSELNYITQIVIMMYEDPTKEKNSEERFHIEIHFSPGAYGVNVPTSNNSAERTTSNGRGYRPNKGRSHVSPIKTSNEEVVGSDDDDDMKYLDQAVEAHSQDGSVVEKTADRSSDAEFICNVLPEEPLLEDDVDGVVSDLQSKVGLNPHEASAPIFVRQQQQRVTVDSLTVLSTISKLPQQHKPVSLDNLPQSMSLLEVGGTSPPRLNDHSASNKRHHSIAGGMQHASPTGSALISTKVISGSHSAPNLHDINENRALEAYGMAVPEIMPLETLHNSLTLAHFDKFLTNVIDMGTLSPKRSYSAMPVSLVGSLAAAVCGRSRSGPSKSRPKLPDGVGSNYDGAKMQQSCAAFSKAIDLYDEGSLWLASLNRHQSMAVQTVRDSEFSWSNLDNIDSFLSCYNSEPMTSVTSATPAHETSITNQPSCADRGSHLMTKLPPNLGPCPATIDTVPSPAHLGPVPSSAHHSSGGSRISHQAKDRPTQPTLDQPLGSTQKSEKTLLPDYKSSISSGQLQPASQTDHSGSHAAKDKALQLLTVGPTTELKHSASAPIIQATDNISNCVNKSPSVEAMFLVEPLTADMPHTTTSSQVKSSEHVPPNKDMSGHGSQTDIGNHNIGNQDII